ncbi:MAG: DUF2934 domain-containing protein [Rhizobiaceae bacterium]
MDKEERIRRRAHEIWEQEGRPHGRDREHWEKAAREIEGEQTGSGSPNGSGASVKDAYDERRDNPGSTGETIPPPVAESKPKRPRAKRVSKA